MRWFRHDVSVWAEGKAPDIKEETVNLSSTLPRPAIGYLLFFSFVALSACSTSRYRDVTPDEVAQLIAAIQGPGTSIESLPVRWVEPSNQPVPCKLYRRGKFDTTQQVLWDGACKDGYAYGLGREFMVGANASGASARIARYHGGQTPPTYCAWSKFAEQAFDFGQWDKGYVEVRKAQESLDGYMQFLGQNDATGGYLRTRWVANGVTEATHLYPSGITVVSQTRSDPADEIASHGFVHKNLTLYGYGIVKMRDRSMPLSGTGATGFELLQLPQSYIDFLNSSARETRQHLAEADKYAGEGFRSMLQYRATFCVSAPSTFKEPTHYRDICQPLGDLTSLVAKLTALDQSRSAKELTNAQALSNPTERTEQVQLATIAQNRRYLTLSATTNRLLTQMGRAPSGTYSMQHYTAIEVTDVQPAEQPYCFDLSTFSACTRPAAATPHF